MNNHMAQALLLIISIRHFPRIDDGSMQECFHMLNTKETIRSYIQEKTIPIWIFLGNVPLHWKEPQIRHFFEDYGVINNVILVKKNTVSIFAGIAYICFNSMTCANYAIDKLNDKWNKELKVQFRLKWLDTEQSRLGITQGGDHKLFIGSLPRQARREDLYDLFSQIGEVESVRLQEKQFWAFVDYKYKQSALLAIRLCNGQVYFHGSHIPIEVRFKQRKYNSFMLKKHEKEDIDPFFASLNNKYYQVLKDNMVWYYHLKTKQAKAQRPPVGALVRRLNDNIWYEIKNEQVPSLDPLLTTKKFGPVGSNLFLFHLPNDVQQLEIYELFLQFGTILSVRIMKEKSGKSKGIGFVSFDRPDAASKAIEEMNGFELGGKRLKVQLNKKDEDILGKTPTRLQTYSIYS